MFEHDDKVVKVIEFGDADEVSDMELAMRIGEILQQEYPSHPWVVSFAGRGLILRHLAIASEVSRVIGRDGFASLLPRENLGTAKEVRQTVKKFAGELLEAFSLPRGPWDGRLPVVPDFSLHQDGRFS